MSTIRENIGTIFVTSVIGLITGLLTIFSDKIVENVKLAINRADHQYENFDKLATDFSDYMSAVGWAVEFYDKGFTKKSSLEMVIPKYNDAIINMRKREYVNLALIHRYWSEGAAKEFKEIMKKVREIDMLIHDLNSEAEQIESGKKEKADPAITKPVIEKIKPLLNDLESRVDVFLSELT